jgi:hypothetical protein
MSPVKKTKRAATASRNVPVSNELVLGKKKKKSVAKAASSAKSRTKPDSKKTPEPVSATVRVKKYRNQKRKPHL